MKTDIIIAGVGGQGILTIAACIGMAAMKGNLYMKQSEVHGMSQRGGAVQSNLRISDHEISSDLIPLGQADLIIAVEPMESLRYLPWLSAYGYLVTNTTPVKNIDDYPELNELLEAVRSVKNHIVIDADNIARDIGSIRSSNIVMLGAATPYINLKYQTFEDGITGVFGRKGKEVTEVNLRALKAGREFSEKTK